MLQSKPGAELTKLSIFTPVIAPHIEAITSNIRRASVLTPKHLPHVEFVAEVQKDGYHRSLSISTADGSPARAHDGRRRDGDERTGQGLSLHRAPTGRRYLIIDTSLCSRLHSRGDRGRAGDAFREVSAPVRQRLAPSLPAPVLLGLALHRRMLRALALAPVACAAGAVRRAE